MKPNLKKQIESSQKGIDYVDSLVPTNNDVIGAVIEQIKDSKYSPNYVKYHDGEKWVEVWKDNPQPMKAKEIGLNWEIAQRAMKNNIPETISKLNRRKEIRFVIFIWSIVAMGVVLWTLGFIYLIKR